MRPTTHRFISINQSKFIWRPFKIPTQRRSRPRPSGKEQSLEGGGIENRHRLGGALDRLEVHSRFLGQPQKMNGSALSQSGRMGSPNYREHRTGVYDGLHIKREGSRACADRKAPSQTSTATPRTQSCKRCAVGMEASAIHPAYSGICGQLPEPANKSSRSSVDPPQLLHPNPRETSEDGTAIIKAAEHKSMNKGDSSIKSQRPSNDLSIVFNPK